MINQAQTVLIVDDEKSNLKILSDLLRDEVKVVLAKSGEQALAKAALLKPDLILLDIVMPQMDGFTVIRLLQQRAETSAIPVIFISALGDVGSEIKGFELGACDYIHKPFQATIVKARIKLHLQLAKQRRMLEELANIDPLTAVANRRRLNDKLAEEWQRCLVAHLPFSVAMLDIDYFKQYNDHYGHAAGDHALSKVAQTLEKHLQGEHDFVARYGGEEFLLVLPGSDANTARQRLETCLAAVKELQLPHESISAHPWLTLSAGGASCLPGNRQVNAERLVQLADGSLYEAKQAGRNRLIWQGDDNTKRLAQSG
ncbi:diguanylate cyclase domain-containing protein [Balneatrix alpica]|uniref:diguanylate cyclase n=1 Tax=Balneatrix alpica TaxID=75684 RepID=A0ABV5Z8T6_9GAMM|nr:diguanylate cyclase [Balneatrix alpica]